MKNKDWIFTFVFNTIYRDSTSLFSSKENVPKPETRNKCKYKRTPISPPIITKG